MFLIRAILSALFVLVSLSAYAEEGVGGGTGVSGTKPPKGCPLLGTDDRGVYLCIGSGSGGSLGDTTFTGRLSFIYQDAVAGNTSAYDLGVNPSCVELAPNPAVDCVAPQGQTGANLLWLNGTNDYVIPLYSQMATFRNNTNATAATRTITRDIGARYAGYLFGHTCNNMSDCYGIIGALSINNGYGKAIYGATDILSYTPGVGVLQPSGVGNVARVTVARGVAADTVMVQEAQSSMWGTAIQSFYTRYETAKQSNEMQFGQLSAQNIYYTGAQIKGFTGNDGVATFSAFTAGSGYAEGTYLDQGLTGGTGFNAGVDIVVDSSGVVTSVSVISKGSGYTVGDVLTLEPTATMVTQNPGGSGFDATVGTVADSGGDFLTYTRLHSTAGNNLFRVTKDGEIIQGGVTNQAENFRLDTAGTANFYRGNIVMGSTQVPGRTVTFTNNHRTFTLQPISTNLKVTAATPVANGTGYAANATFNVTPAGTAVTPTVISVSTDGSGVVSVNSVSTPGEYTAELVSPNPVTGGTGTGMTLNLTMGPVAKTRVIAATVNAAGTCDLSSTFNVVPSDAAISPAAISVTTDGAGAVTTINSVVTAGIYAASLTTPNTVTGGNCVGTTLNLTSQSFNPEGYLRLLAASSGDVIQAAAANAGNPLSIFVNGAVRNVTAYSETAGANSCGAGYRCLRVPN